MSGSDGPDGEATSHALNQPLEADAMRVLAVVGETFRQRHVWPVFDYVERVLSHDGIDAQPVVTSLMKLRGVRQTYGLVWTSQGRQLPVRAETRVGLTVAGMSRLPSLRPLASAFAGAIHILATDERSLEPNPDEVVGGESDVAMVTTWIQNALARDPRTWRGLPTARVHDLLLNEPPTFGALGSPCAREDNWPVRLSVRLRPYRDAPTLEDYLAVTALVEAEPVFATEPIAPSPLSLPEALDFLDAVWRNVHQGRPLFSHRSHGSSARLALGCATSEELDACLSALKGVLDGMDVPASEDGIGDGSLTRLQHHLTGLGAAARRVEPAVKTLKTIATLRDKAQHAPSSRVVIKAYDRLGIDYPPSKPAQTWDQIVSRAVRAIEVLREELQAVRDRPAEPA